MTKNKYVVWGMVLVGAFLLISGIAVGGWVFIILGAIFLVARRNQGTKK
jgi:hypothetical protein